MDFEIYVKNFQRKLGVIENRKKLNPKKQLTGTTFSQNRRLNI